MKISLFLLFYLFSQLVMADSTANLQVTNLRFHYDWVSGATGFVTVGVDKVPAEINTHSSDSSICFEFDARSEEGKLMFSMLLTAKSSNQKIKVWYTPKKDGGNTVGTLSKLQIVELR